ncbi:MAG: tetratricopeptide repeat protein [Kiritimatiellia bacterium]
MRKTIIFPILAVLTFVNLFVFSVCAKEREKLNVSELLEDANAFMAEAQDVYVEGDSDKAVGLYRKALAEIKKIERRYPDRVTSSGFAPLRFRRALCETELDRILLEKVDVASRTVAVTDTRELEKKRRERREAAKTNRLAKVSEKLSLKNRSGVVDFQPEPDENPRSADQTKTVEQEQTTVEQEQILDSDVELDWAADMLEAGRQDEAEKSLIKVLRAYPDNFKARFMLTLLRIRNGQLRDAQIIMEGLLQDYSRNEGVLLLASGLYLATEQYADAMSALDRVLKIAPHRPESYLNMAWLLLKINPGELNDPEMYYRRSVELGGARDQQLERRLGIRKN